jgi:transposase
LIFNYFKAKEQGAVEDLNNKAKMTTKKAYGFKSFEIIKLALYHTLGDLHEPVGTHRFCG